MAREHSFYIPDIEHVGDFEGLFKFLGIKIGVYHVCLWCSSKCYPTLKAVQQHMFDKGHSKIRFESDTLYEYADFYAYSDEDDGDYNDENDDEDMSGDEAVNDVKNFIEDESYELVLPSGKWNTKLKEKFKEKKKLKSIRGKNRTPIIIPLLQAVVRSSQLSIETTNEPASAG
jgi:pre-60S factor REI1